jgi:hypothetical protein
MSLLTQIAEYLNDQSVGIFDETGITGNIFIAAMPQSPDTCISIYPSGGLKSDSKFKYDNPTFQVMVRGTTNSIVANDLAQTVYNTLDGFHGDTFINGGFWVVSCFGIQSQPTWIGIDANNRHEFSLNFQIEYENTGKTHASE